MKVTEIGEQNGEGVEGAEENGEENQEEEDLKAIDEALSSIRDEVADAMEEADQPYAWDSKRKMPRRHPTIHEKPREIIYISADKTTCLKCICFPKEDPYDKHKKLNPCQHTPLTLYELAARVVDGLRFPDSFTWTPERVANWVEFDVGYPQYRNCILDNNIDGRRLLLLEDPSHFPMINIRYFDHIKVITAKIRELFSTEFIRFSRSIGLPPRKPLTHCTWFKSRTGPPWAIRSNWTRTDILRWMCILDPEPLHLDHWDLVWHMKPDFPKTLFGRIPSRPGSAREVIPRFPAQRKSPPCSCREYMIPRKFRFDRTTPAEKQFIWMEHGLGSPRPNEYEWVAAQLEKESPGRDRKPATVPKPSRLDPPVVDLTGLKGRQLLLARRLQPKQKFWDFRRYHRKEKH